MHIITWKNADGSRDEKRFDDFKDAVVLFDFLRENDIEPNYIKEDSLKGKRSQAADIWDGIVFTVLAIIVIYLFMFLTPNTVY